MNASKIYYVPTEKTLEDTVIAMRNTLDHRAFRLFRSFFRKQIIGLFISCKLSENEREILLPFISSAADSLKNKDSWAFICDTSNRHKNIDSNALEQIQNTYCGTFQDMKNILPCFMLDGINGNYEYVCRSSDNSEETYLGGEIPNLDGLIVFSIPRKNDLCGISGSLFNLGEGLASKRGKIKLYTQDKPQVNVKKCYACRRCLYACPVKAIYMGDRHVVIDNEKCIDCGRCAEIAKSCGISYEWNATPEYFQNRMMLQAAAGIKILTGKIIFITIIPKTGGSVEVLISRDPVAVDSATLDMFKRNKNFDDVHLDSFEQQIKNAADAGIGTMKYDKMKIAY